MFARSSCSKKSPHQLVSSPSSPSLHPSIPPPFIPLRHVYPRIVCRSDGVISHGESGILRPSRCVNLTLVVMFCKQRMHDHSSSRVMESTNNPTRPPGGRPFHCPECWFVKHQTAIREYWHRYSNIEAAKKGNHIRHAVCF